MSSSLSTASHVHIKSSFLHSSGKVGQVAATAAAITSSIAQQQKHSTNGVVVAASQLHVLAGQSKSTTSTSSAGNTVCTSTASSDIALPEPALVNCAESNGACDITTASISADAVSSDPPPLPVDDNNNKSAFDDLRSSFETAASASNPSNDVCDGSRHEDEAPSVRSASVRPSTLLTASTKSPKWPPPAPLKSPKSPRKISVTGFGALKHNYGRSKSHQRPPIPRKPSFLRKKRPQSAVCNSSNSTGVTNNEADIQEESDLPAIADAGEECASTSTAVTAKPTEAVNSSGRPLPPPPIPPRPRLIPAHYAIRTPVEKRDACVDTSENGFLEFHCSEKEVQVKLLSRPGSLASQESRDSVTLVPFQGTPIRPIEETNLDDDDEPTIIGEVKSRLPTQTPGELDSQGRQYSRESAEFEIRDEPRDQETITSATVYMDARSRLTDQQTLTQPVPNHAEDLPHFENDLSDDETINDNISSIASSEYQSFCSSIHSAPPAVPGAGSSWLHNVATSHRQQPPTQAHSADEVNSPRPSAPATEGPVTANTTTTTTEDEYLSAMDGLNAASNRSSLLSNDPMMLEDGELSFEAFQSAFANLTTSSPMAEGEPSSDTAEQRQSSVDLEDAAVSGQASAETKRINRQSVISTVSSTSSSDTSSSSIFHTHSSSPTSSYSFDSSVSLTSIPQAQISITGSTASTGSTFYANAIGAGTSSDADHAERAKEPEVTASTSIDASEPTLESDGCVPSKAASVASTGSNVVVVSPSPQSLPENLSRLPTATPNGSTPSSAYYIAHELWLTERDYVDILKMLTVEFREAIRDTVSTYFLNKFFRPLDQVLPINEMLLNDLQKRVLTDWDDNPKISDIMINVCPFFKEYSIFVREFDQLNHMLDEATEIFPNFTEALNRFQHLERCKKLSIKSYLLKPIQRLPQYPLLLSTYLKKLKPDDGDFENTQRALSVVTKVVEHVNRESHMAEKAMRLAELKNRIVAKAPDAIVKPGRELIKQGLLHKVSRKEVHERFFILFNDVFLYCVPVMNDMIKINEEFPLDGMEVEISNQSESEFVVRSTRRSFALMARNTEERKEWVDALEAAIAENDAKKTSFEAARGHSSSHIPTTGRSLSRRSSSPTRSDSFSEFDHSLSDAASPKVADKELHHQESIQSTQSTSSMADRKNHHPATGLGERAPVWVHDHRVSMCQGCMREFTFLFRRHHCRACGAVVCSDCSSHHYPLKYRKFEPQRVCDNCFETLSKLHPDWLAGEDSNTKGSGSTRVSPNNSLSTADLVNIKQSRSNSCTNLGDSFDWTTDEHNKSLPVPLQDHNHNPTTGILNLSLTRSPIRHSSRFNRKNIPAVLIEVPANDASSKQSGFMFRLSAKKSWKRFWFVIKEMVLYTYKASEDVAALESLPLPGYKVSTSKESIKGQPASLIIELSHPGRSTIYFLTDNPDAHQRWLKAFCECAELH